MISTLIRGQIEEWDILNTPSQDGKKSIVSQYGHISLGTEQSAMTLDKLEGGNWDQDIFGRFRVNLGHWLSVFIQDIGDSLPNNKWITLKPQDKVGFFNYRISEINSYI